MIVRPDLVDDAWPAVREWIESAMVLSLGESAELLKEHAERDLAQLWVCGNGAAVTRVFEGKKRVVQIVALGGKDKREWMDELIGEIKDFARSHKCDAILATGRPGWVKEFKRHGAKLERVTAVYEVTHA